ncbi:MFS transporter [Nocardia sp. NBC_00565]|uniref:MFS transporter n=1 Tax=Nocardia sp. NBC_00565 TaxID=2975993 RepID=UPI002E804578|nr:MFS transporter [Nocardia sp. NBC_00565]WUC06724.1 MFS transporter [Nocardia sp. NBC_00565]
MVVECRARKNSAVPRRALLCLGISQMVCWGVTYYLIGIFGDRIAADLGWSSTLVQGGFSVALLIMGLTSAVTGRCIDRYGGRPVMAAGSVLAAFGCAGVAVATTPIGYFAAWACLGSAMRCTLYDAAFAALARIGGPAAKQSMSQITLLGGLASSVFWPIGHGLAELLGWRGALLCYAACALLTLPLHLVLPNSTYVQQLSTDGVVTPAPTADGPRDRWIAGGLYAVVVAGAGFLASGLSAHLIGILTGLGLAATAAVWVSTLRGITQSVARLFDVLFGRRRHPLDLNVIAVALLTLSFPPGFGGGQLVILAFACTALYGAGNGLATITRGTLPLVLFDHRDYGSFTGRLLLPSFVLSAAAPVTYAVMIENYGATGALGLSTAVALGMLAAAVILRARYRVTS